jgi:hypothetical protein
LGTLFRLIIGAPSDVPLGVYSYNPTNFTGFNPINDSTICSGDGIYFTMLPYNNSSDYSWTLNTQNNWSTDQFTGLLFNSLGNYTMSVIETNYGCVGVGSDTANIQVSGAPLSNISGPSQVSTNDTISYSTFSSSLSIYNWNCNNALVINETESNFEVVFPTSGNYQVQCTVTNICSSSTTTKSVNAIAGLGNSENEIQDEIKLINTISDGLFQLQIKNNLFNDYLINIYQTNGIEVYTTTINGYESVSTYTLPLNSIRAGIYFLKISSKKQSKIFKIVKV